MWVIRTVSLRGGEVKYHIGYYAEINGLNQFEVFDTFENKLEAMKCCHYLNGGS